MNEEWDVDQIRRVIAEGINNMLVLYQNAERLANAGDVSDLAYIMKDVFIMSQSVYEEAVEINNLERLWEQ